MSDQMVLRWNLTFPHRPGYELRDILASGSADITPLIVNQTSYVSILENISFTSDINNGD